MHAPCHPSLRHMLTYVMLTMRGVNVIVQHTCMLMVCRLCFVCFWQLLLMRTILAINDTNPI